MSNAIITTGLTKHYGSTVGIQDLNLQVAEGEVFGLLGPNGAGKTTTVRLLACLLTPTAGSARVAGYDMATEPDKIRPLIGLLGELPGLYERLTAYEYLDFFGEIYDVPTAVRRARIEELLTMLGIWERRGDRLGKFSKGMKQKIAIARTLIHDPPLLFLDEPTAGLDPESAKTVRDYILELTRERQRTVLLCTHNLDEADRLCDRVAVINCGHLVAVGHPAELKSRVVGGQRVRLQLRQVRPAYLQAVDSIPGVSQLIVEDNFIVFTAKQPEVVNPRVLAAVAQAGGEVVYLMPEEPSLEQAYLQLLQEGQDA